MSLYLADVSRARLEENKAVMSAIMPIRARMFLTKYNGMTPIIGRTEDNTVTTRDESFVVVSFEGRTRYRPTSR